MEENLWVENLLNVAQVHVSELPIDILQKAAKELSKKTNNIIETQISTYFRNDMSFGYIFYINNSKTANKLYQLFRVEHNYACYPVVIILNDCVYGDYNSSEEFKNGLRLLFSGTTVLTIVANAYQLGQNENKKEIKENG